MLLKQTSISKSEAFTCCVSHHGRADRLQYYTGDSWDLPCDCGLRSCEAAEQPAPGSRCCRRRDLDVGTSCTWAADAHAEAPPPSNPEKDLL